MDYSNIINLMDGENSSVISLSKTLLIFYVVIASQYTGNLLGKQMREFIQENRIAQHIIAFTMLLVLINLVGGVKDMKKGILYSLVGYVWFIFTTKLDIQWNLIIILLLVVGYLYESNMFNHENIISSNNVLTPEEKEKVINKNKFYRSMIVAGIIIITLIGTFLYEQKKGAQYGGGFSIKKYMFY